MTRKFGVPIIHLVSSNHAADGRHKHAALVHAAARLGKHRHRGRQRDTKGRRRTASLNQPLLTQVRAAGRLGQAPQNPELGGLEKYGLRHALGCQEKKSPDQRPPERIRPVLKRGPSRWRPSPGRRRDGVTGSCPPAQKGLPFRLLLMLEKSRGVHGSHRSDSKPAQRASSSIHRHVSTLPTGGQ